MNIFVLLLWNELAFNCARNPSRRLEYLPRVCSDNCLAFWWDNTGFSFDLRSHEIAGKVLGDGNCVGLIWSWVSWPHRRNLIIHLFQWFLWTFKRHHFIFLYRLLLGGFLNLLCPLCFLRFFRFFMFFILRFFSRSFSFGYYFFLLIAATFTNGWWHWASHCFWFDCWLLSILVDLFYVLTNLIKMSVCLRNLAFSIIYNLWCNRSRLSYVVTNVVLTDIIAGFRFFPVLNFRSFCFRRRSFLRSDGFLLFF